MSSESSIHPWTQAAPALPWDQGDHFVTLVRDVFDVYDVTELPEITRAARGKVDPRQVIAGFNLEGLPYMPHTVRLRGRLKIPAERAYQLVAERFRREGYTPFFRGDGQDQVILAIPGALPEARPNVVLAVILFIATLISVTISGFDMSYAPNQGLLQNILGGLQFSLPLLAILLCHEFGHYLMARLYNTPVSLPYFIPLPVVGLFGTMGAFISMKAPPSDRKALFAIAAAGPLGGLIVAVPVLIAGLLLSHVQPLPTGPYLAEGNSLLYLLLKLLLFGQILPNGHMDVSLHPMAFAGWAGLLVTALNLIPAGQLDGGHIVHALLGERSKYLTYLIIAILLALGLVWPGWWLWAVLIYFLGRRQAIVLNELTSIDLPRQILAVVLVVIFILIFTPIPLAQG
ncbi:MAG: site-2 protease family protein [Chloroflexi bacterium]|nr:site-2 protease family protein [Chloroflexota bacterium]